MRKFLTLLLVGIAGSAYAPSVNAQYVQTHLNNRALKKTHIKVANSGPSTPGVICGGAGCVGEVSPFSPSSIACPGSGTCTFEFQVCARIAPKPNGFNDNYFHRIRVDGAVPSPGPVDLSFAIPPGAQPNQQNYCATSAASGISSGNRTVTLSLGVQDLDGDGGWALIPNVVFTIRVYKP